MPPTPEAIVKERAARLRRAGEAALTAELNSRIGGETDVLIEQKDRDGHRSMPRSCLRRP